MAEEHLKSLSAVKEVRSRATVLVVDDDPHYRSILRLTLKSCGIGRVREAVGVATAIRKLEGGRVDLVLLDWWLGQLSGIELVHTMRAWQMDVPVIMLTAERKKTCIVQALRLGVTDYLVKPYTRRQLIARVDNALLAKWGKAGRR